MPITDKDIVLIERHFDGQLNEEEAASFSQKLADSEFTAAVQAHQLSVDAIRLAGRDRLLRVLDTAEAQFSQTTTPPQYKRLFSIRIWAIAATVLLLISVGLWFFMSRETKTEQLFAENFKPYVSSIGQIERSTPAKDLLSRAFQHYDNQEYSQAILLFEQVNDKNKDIAAFYKANTLLVEGKVASALPIFEALTNQDTFVFKQQTEWYLALSFLKENRVVECQALLQKIAQTPQHPFHKEAINLLTRLE